MDRARPWSGPDLPGHARSMGADPRGPGGTAASRLHPEHAGKARSYPLHGNVRCGRNKRRDRINVTLPFLTVNSFPGVPPSRKRKKRSDPVAREILYRRSRGVACYSFRPEVASTPAKRPSATEPITIRPSGMVFPYRVRITMPMTDTTTNIPSTA